MFLRFLESVRRLRGRIPPRSRSRRGRLSLVGPAFVAPALVLVVLLFIVPLGLAGYMSLNSWPLFGVPHLTGLTNYVNLLDDQTLTAALVFTAAFAVVTTATTIFVGFGLALLVSGTRRGVALFRTAFFLPVVVGIASASFLWIWLLNDDVGPIAALIQATGLTPHGPQLFASTDSAVASVIIMTTWKSSGFAMLLFIIGIHAIPQEVLEAALVDGASRVTQLRYVILPLLRPTFALSMILVGTQNLLAFDQFYIMTRGGPFNSTITATYWVYSKAFVGFSLGYACAGAFLLLAAVVVINGVQLRVLRGTTGSSPV